MENIDHNPVSMRVLRHSFRPSEQLSVALDQFMENGVVRPRSFLYASRMVTVDASPDSNAALRPEINALQKAFLRRSKEKIQVGGVFERSGRRVLAARLAGGALRIGLLPHDDQSELFMGLITPIDSLRSPDLPSISAPVEYVYATVAARDVASDAAIKTALIHLHEILDDPFQARQYVMNPAEIKERLI